MEKLAAENGKNVANTAVELTLGLCIHPINYGKKSTGTTSYSFNWVTVTHVEMVESSENLDAELHQLVLKSYNVKSIYREKVHLTPVMDRNQTSTTKERVFWCQIQHKQVLDGLNMDY